MRTCEQPASSLPPPFTRFAAFLGTPPRPSFADLLETRELDGGKIGGRRGVASARDDGRGSDGISARIGSQAAALLQTEWRGRGFDSRRRRLIPELRVEAMLRVHISPFGRA